MPNTWRVPENDVPICPDCQGDLSFVGAWTARGLWGYNEVRTYECPEHGPVFISPQVSIGHGPDKSPEKDPEKHPEKHPENSDRDLLIPAPRKPTPTLNVGGIAVPEPDSN